MAVSNIGTGGGGFAISAGITVNEIDLTTVVPAVSTTEAALAGVFHWGPIDKITLVTSQNQLAAKFGKPSNHNAETWFSGANFLDYSGALLVSRAANTAAVLSATANSSAVTSQTAHTAKNEDHFQTLTIESGVHYIARYPGAFGNSLRVSQCDTAAQFSSNISLTAFGSNTLFGDAATKYTINVGANTANVVLANTAALTANTPLTYAQSVADAFSVGDYVEVGNTTIGRQKLKISAVGAVTVQNTAGTNSGIAFFTLSFADSLKLAANATGTTVSRYWEFHNVVNLAPGQSEFVAAQGNTSANDEMHIVITDQDGKFTGNPGTVLEVWESVSRATDARRSDGTNLYYKDLINQGSVWVYAGSDRSGAVSNTALNVTSASTTLPLTLSFVGGADGVDEASVAISDLARAYDLFASETVDPSFIIAGKARGGVVGEQMANYLIDNLCEVRKDCVACISPDKNDVVNNNSDPEADVKTFFDSVRSSSYSFFDSGYKYQYDKYNDVYRWIPLNGDMAGLLAQTAEPWFSPAGPNHGFVKNVVRLAFNPDTKALRDLLYKNRINPVVTFKGQGTLLWGDKTGLAKPSAFDRINVRRLFIALEKAIAIAAQSSLFEINDEFTQAQFKNLVEPYLRDVQGRRGIYDFRVVCDETNNTPEVIDQNRFIGDIYIKPARTINFIQLNFIAVRTGAEFQEIVGRF